MKTTPCLHRTTPVKEFNEKNQLHALELYVGPGFAHYKSQAACNELIGKKIYLYNMSGFKRVGGPGSFQA